MQIIFNILIIHKARSVIQRVRRFHLDRHQIIQMEVDNLLKVGFIKEVKYLEWLAKVVVVLKKGGKCKTREIPIYGKRAKS